MLKTKELLTLNQLPGVGKVALLHLMKASNAQPGIPLNELLQRTKESYSRLRLPDEATLSKATDKAGQLVTLMDENGLSLVQHAELPEKLQSIPNPPAFLLVKGDTSILDDAGIAVIGTRNPTKWGEKVGRRFGAILAERGYVVVSGLAIGCDTAGHVGCLEAGGKTVAVMPCGLDQIYPESNTGLAKEIIDSGGCLVSEYLPGTIMHKSSFVERDRIQSGLSKAVIVIETGIKGGTQHTVKFALDQRRLVACVDHPPELHHESCVQGNRGLIENLSATPLKDKESLVQFLEQLGANQPNETQESLF